MPVTTSDFQTTVKNTSGAKLYFGYLGAHGRWLDANETFSEHGDIRQKLAANDKVRPLAAFHKDLKGGVLSLLATPVVIVRQEGSPFAPKAIVVNGTTLSVVDPHWHQADSNGGVPD